MRKTLKTLLVTILSLLTFSAAYSQSDGNVMRSDSLSLEGGESVFATEQAEGVWRVNSLDDPIPFSVIIKDMDGRDEGWLYYISVYDVTGHLNGYAPRPNYWFNLINGWCSEPDPNKAPNKTGGQSAIYLWQCNGDKKNGMLVSENWWNRQPDTFYNNNNTHRVNWRYLGVEGQKVTARRLGYTSAPVMLTFSIFAPTKYKWYQTNYYPEQIVKVYVDNQSIRNPMGGWYNYTSHLHTWNTEITNDPVLESIHNEWGWATKGFMTLGKVDGLDILGFTDHSCFLDDTGYLGVYEPDPSPYNAVGYWTRWQHVGDEAAKYNSGQWYMPLEYKPFLVRGAEINAHDDQLTTTFNGSLFGIPVFNMTWTGNENLLNHRHLKVFGCGSLIEGAWAPTCGYWGVIGLAQVQGRVYCMRNVLSGRCLCHRQDRGCENRVVSNNVYSQGGYAYLAHPTDYNINGDQIRWGPITIQPVSGGPTDQSLENSVREFMKNRSAKGMELLNGGYDENSRYQHEVKDVNIWDKLLREYLTSDPVVYPAARGGQFRKITIDGGCDTHNNPSGNQKWVDSQQISPGSPLSGLGRRRSVLYVPGGLNESNVLAAHKRGNSVVTSGPFVTFWIDKMNDSPNAPDDDDLIVGDGDDDDNGFYDSKVILNYIPETIKTRFFQKSCSQFGSVSEAVLKLGTSGSTSTVRTFTNPGQTFYVNLRDIISSNGKYYLRVEGKSVKDGLTMRCYTNPIWIYVNAQVPPPPSELDGLPEVTPAQIVLSWADNSKYEEVFEIFRTVRGQEYSAYPIAEVGENVTEYIDHNVLANVTYCYRIRAKNAGGASDFSNEIEAAVKLEIPQTPADFHVVSIEYLGGPVEQWQVKLAWKHSGELVEWFRINSITPIKPEAREYEGEFMAGHYELNVFACNQAGESEPSNTVVFDLASPAQSGKAFNRNKN